MKLSKTIKNKKYTIVNKMRAFNGFNYRKWKENRQKDFDKLPIYWAFGEQQFKELLQKLNLQDTSEDLKKLTNIGCGGIMRKCDLYLLKQHNETFSSEILKKWLKNNFNFAYDAFKFEMANHEFGYTYEIEDTLYSLDLSFKDIQQNALLKLAFLRAKKDYLKEYNECN